jgi:molecular chaperone DnaK (HSP70)
MRRKLRYSFREFSSKSLGNETTRYFMIVLIQWKNFVLTKKNKIFTSYSDNKPTITIKVYEEKQSRIRNNNLLGKFYLTRIWYATKVA